MGPLPGICADPDCNFVVAGPIPGVDASARDLTRKCKLIVLRRVQYDALISHSSRMTAAGSSTGPDFRAVFDAAPTPLLLLSSGFVILAVSISPTLLRSRRLLHARRLLAARSPAHVVHGSF